MNFPWGAEEVCGPWQEGPHGRWRRCGERVPDPSPEDAAAVARVREQVLRRVREMTPLTRAETETARRLIAEALG